MKKIKLIKFLRFFTIFSFFVSLFFLLIQLALYLNYRLSFQKYKNDIFKLDRENSLLEIELSQGASLEKIEQLTKNGFVKQDKLKIIVLPQEIAKQEEK